MKIIECNLSHTGPYTRRSKTDMVVVHHAAASCATVWEINDWHLGNGWNGIGYHYYVRKDGSIYRGRPEWAVGSHAIGSNDRSIGICCEGDYMTETMGAAQLTAVKALLRDIMGRYGKLALKRHKDVCSTDCPGNRFPWAEIQNYRDEAEEMSYEQFKAYMARYVKEMESKPVSNYAKGAWEAAIEQGVTDGTAPGMYMTREQNAVMMQRTGMIGKK